MRPLIASYLVNRMSGGRIKFGWWAAHFESTERPIILGGCSRSGTSLLREMLNSHPDIYIGPETAIFQGNRQFDHLSRVTALPYSVLQKFYRRSCCLAEFGELVLKQLAKDSGKSTWGEKTPANVRCIGELFRFFPGARFIHIVRDGRDVVCSLRTHPKYEWRDGSHVRTGIVNHWDACADQWVRDVLEGMRFADDPRCYQLRYERLVSAPRDEMARLLTWLGHTWNESVITNYKRENQPNHPALAGEISRTSVARWQKDLPTEARQIVNRRCGELLIELGYADANCWGDQ